MRHQVHVLALVAAGLSAAGGLPAQEERSERRSAAVDEGAPLAKLVVETAPPRCFPTERSPAYDETLHEGATFRVGEKHGSFRQVFLPLGVVGFVHADFVDEPVLEGDEAGTVRTTGERVSFRYRPESTEPPVARMPKGTALLVLEREGDWLRVRHPDQPAWVPEKAMQVIDPPNETILAAYAAAEKVAREPVDGFVAARLRERQEAAERAARAERLEAVRGAFAAVMRKEVEERTFDAVEAKLEELAGELPEDSPLHGPVEVLAKEIEQQRWLAEAVTVVEEEAKPAADVAPPEPHRTDGLARFEAVGWLRHHPRREGHLAFSLEKGDQVLFWVTCTSHRYDLSLFDGVEVGLVGRTERPDPESLRVLDVSRIEVLGVAPR